MYSIIGKQLQDNQAVSLSLLDFRAGLTKQLTLLVVKEFTNLNNFVHLINVNTNVQFQMTR